MLSLRQLCLCSCLMLSLSSHMVLAQPGTEANVIAAQARFLQQLVHFVNWHSMPQVAVDTDTRAQFCFLAPLAEQDQGKQVATADNDVYLWFREQTTLTDIELHRFREPSQLNAHWTGRHCHVIFGSYEVVQQWPLLLLQDYARRTLVLSDDIRFIEQGGMGSLSFENRRVRLYINRNILNQSDISLRSRLMQVTRFYPEEE